MLKKEVKVISSSARIDRIETTSYGIEGVAERRKKQFQSIQELIPNNYMEVKAQLETIVDTLLHSSDFEHFEKLLLGIARNPLEANAFISSSNCIFILADMKFRFQSQRRSIYY